MSIFFYLVFGVGWREGLEEIAGKERRGKTIQCAVKLGFC